MLNTAVKRPQFLATATINLHTAVAMDRLLSEACTAAILLLPPQSAAGRKLAGRWMRHGYLPVR
jgi:hypothetical protein